MADFRTAHPAAQPGIPSGGPSLRKSATGENFPVASRLIPAPLRPHVMAFYAFARLADDIADDPLAEPDMRIAQLDALERALVSGVGNQPWLAPALQLKASQAATGVSGLHARQLLQAFRRDALGSHCRQWDDLLLYCRYSANPVGRFLLELHGESMAAAPAADALCTALQILNHVQDCRSDWVDIGRCYMPLNWFDEAGGSAEQLVERQATPAVRQVINRVLDRVDELLVRAETLPCHIINTGLRLEAAVIVSLAQSLSRRLRQNDPLAARVQLGSFARLGAVVKGVVRGIAHRPARRGPCPSLSKQAGENSTFYWPLRFLAPDKRQAMFAIYGFCRAVDDIADGPGTAEAKRVAVAEWRRRVDALYSPATAETERNGPLRDLAAAIDRYKLPQAELQAVVDGMMMDIDGPVRAPEPAVLELYCRRVAGAVGLLCVRVFGRSDAEADAFAVAVGHSLQLTNILRDLAEDAAIGRCYMPADILLQVGIDPAMARRDPQAVLGHPAFPAACEALALRTEDAFRRAATLLKGDVRPLRPAIAMIRLYYRILRRLRQRGWSPAALLRRPKLSKLEKIRIAAGSIIGRPPRP